MRTGTVDENRVVEESRRYANETEVVGCVTRERDFATEYSTEIYLRGKILKKR